MKSIQQKSGHTKWEYKYHVVWIPKYRKKKLYKELRQYLGEMLRDLAVQKECTIEEGHLMSDHVHMLVSIPPKYSVAQIVGFLKGKSPEFNPEVLYQLHEHILEEERILQGNTSGQEDTMSQQWEEMKQ